MNPIISMLLNQKRPRAHYQTLIQNNNEANDMPSNKRQNRNLLDELVSATQKTASIELTVLANITSNDENKIEADKRMELHRKQIKIRLHDNMHTLEEMIDDLIKLIESVKTNYDDAGKSISSFSNYCKSERNKTLIPLGSINENSINIQISVQPKSLQNKPIPYFNIWYHYIQDTLLHIIPKSQNKHECFIEILPLDYPKNLFNTCSNIMKSTIEYVNALRSIKKELADRPMESLFSFNSVVASSITNNELCTYFTVEHAIAKLNVSNNMAYRKIIYLMKFISDELLPDFNELKTLNK
jgi:hypothetical protein